MDAELLRSKVHWEGGVIATLEYGLRAEDIADSDLATLWQEAADLYARLRPIVVEIEAVIRSHSDGR
jgi:hypothetical protein